MEHFEQSQTKKTIKKRSNECSCFIFQYVAFALGEGILEKKVGHFQLRTVPFFIPSLIRRVLTVLLKFVCTFCAIKNKCSWRYIWRVPGLIWLEVLVLGVYTQSYLKYHSHIFPENDSGTKEIISSWLSLSLSHFQGNFPSVLNIYLSNQTSALS